MDGRRRRTNQRRRQPLDVWLRNPHLCGTRIGAVAVTLTWVRPRRHPTSETTNCVRVRVCKGVVFGLPRNLEVSYLAFATSNERHPMIRLFGAR